MNQKAEKKKEINRGFNKHFFEFLGDVAKIYPENNEIKFAIRSFTNIKNLNVTLINKVWNSHVYGPYKEIIDSNELNDNKKIDYFLEKDYTTDLSNVGKAGEILQIVDKVKDTIRSMTPEDKKKCSGYIQNLSKLADAYSKL